MGDDSELASIPPPPGTTDNPPLPPNPPSPLSKNEETNHGVQPNWTHYYYNNFYQQQYAQYYQQLSYMMPGYNYQAYLNQFNKKDDKVQPPLPPCSPNPPLPNSNNNRPQPLLNQPKQFGHIRFQLNTKRLPQNNAILQLNNSPNSGASKKKRKRNRNNQYNLQNNNFTAPPLPPPELTPPKPAPPPETMPPEPPLPPPIEESKPPLPQESPENSQNGFGNPSDDWPESLKDYVHRSYAKCVTAIDKNQVEIILKGKITQAYQNSQLHKDWSREPLPNIHSERPSFTGQAKTVTGQLSQFQNNKKKGISPGLGARLGARRSTLRGKSKSSSRSRSRSRSPAARKTSRSKSGSPKRNRPYR